MGLFDFFKKKKPQPQVNPDLNRTLMDVVHKIGNTNTGRYWEGFKMRKPTDASGIEEICGRDLSQVLDKDAFEIVTSIQRWSANSKIPIPQLKLNFLSQMEQLIEETGGSWNDLINTFKSEKAKEAASFNISPDNTISNFMLEMAVKRQQEVQHESLGRQIARNLNIPEDEIDDFLQRTEDKANELNIAPDISKLDREENRLFALAKEGVDMLDGLSTLSGGEFGSLRMEKNGRAEALILCSTMVMDLHSHFKNEIDMDIQTDRYFLLMADEVMCSIDRDDTIKFINSRIEFYKNARLEMENLNPIAVLRIDNAYGHIFNALYLNPECDDPTLLDTASISPTDLMMFKKKLEDTQKAMLRGRARITGNSSASGEKVRQQAIELFGQLFPISRRSDISQAMVEIFSEVVFGMVKNGGPDAESRLKLPAQAISIVNQLTALFELSCLSDEEKEDLIDDVTHEVAKQFPE